MTTKRDPKFGCAEIYEDIWFVLLPKVRELTVHGADTADKATLIRIQKSLAGLIRRETERTQARNVTEE